jgi:hypothetical protein
MVLHFLVARDVIHQIERQFLDDHPQAACAYLSHKRVTRDGTSRLVAEGDLHILEVEELGVLLQERVSGLVRISIRAVSSSSSMIPITGSRPTNSGMRPYVKRSWGISLTEKL